MQRAAVISSLSRVAASATQSQLFPSSQTTPPSFPPSFLYPLLRCFIQLSPYPSELDRSRLSSLLLDTIGRCPPVPRLDDLAWGSHDRARPTEPCARRTPVSRPPSLPAHTGIPPPATPDPALQRLEKPASCSCLCADNHSSHLLQQAIHLVCTFCSGILLGKVIDLM